MKKWIGIGAALTLLGAALTLVKRTHREAPQEQIEPDTPPARTSGKRWWWWWCVGLVAWSVSVAAPFTHATDTIAAGTKRADMMFLLTAYAVVGLLGVGVGQLLQVMSHGASSGLWNVVDGVGKVIALCGWGIGLTSGVIFFMQETGQTDGWLMAVSAGVAVVPIAVVIALILGGSTMGLMLLVVLLVKKSIDVFERRRERSARVSNLAKQGGHNSI